MDADEWSGRATLASAAAGVGVLLEVTLMKNMKRRSQRAGARRSKSRRGYRDDAGRQSSAVRGYDRDWRKLRNTWIKHHPLCVNAGKVKGCGIGATDVDHIVAIARGGKRLSKHNLQSLCRTCHNRKSARELAGGPASPLFDDQGMPLDVDHHWRKE